ncbi:MAG: hypothetical protein ABWZ80_01710 [Beijerinckiaceae bacterium]
MSQYVVAPACAIILLGLGASAEAQGGRPATQNASSVTVTNLRTAALQQLEISTSDSPAVAVVKMAKPLAPGKSAKLAIKGKRGCMFDVRGAYADDATVENDGVDLCKDSKLRLSE